MLNAIQSRPPSGHRVKTLFAAIATAAAIGLAYVAAPIDVAMAAPGASAAAALSSLWTMQFPDGQYAVVDPAGNVMAVCNDDADIVIAKYSSSGTPLGSWKYGDTNPILAVASDASANVVVATSATVTSVNAAGAVNFHYTPAVPVAAMTVDKSGNVIVAENYWNDSLVIEKLSASGAVVFKKTFSSTGGIEDISLATDSAGNIVVGVTYQMGTINFGGTNLTAPHMDTLIVAKLTANGGHSFSKVFNPTVAKDGSYAGVYEVQVAVKSNNEIIVTGTADGSGSITIGGKKVTMPPEGGETLLLSEFSSAGATNWAKTAGVAGVHAEAIAIDNQDNVVITGEDRSSKFLGLANGVFVAKFAGNTGNLMSSNLVGSTSGYANSIAVNPVNNDIVTTGSNAGSNYMLDLVN